MSLDEQRQKLGPMSVQDHAPSADPKADDVDEPSTLTVPDSAPELKGEFWDSLGPLHPPEDCVPVTSDGGVIKKVLVPGSGHTPTKFARCLVHYLGRLRTNGNIFMDTKTESMTQQPIKVVAGRHTSARDTGLYLAVETMLPGERCLVYVQDPQYGYGEKGSFSFPAVPPSCQLTYEVEMVDWEGQQDDEADEDSSAHLLYEERLERAEARRVKGNELFQAGEYKKAMAKYATALSYLDEDFMMQLEGFYEDKANQVKVPIHLNMAACQVKIQDYHTAIYNCTEVLKIEPGNAKALYRRGVARHALGQSEEALPDLQQAADKAPEDRAIQKELIALKHTMKQEKQAQAKLYKGRFKFPEPVPKSEPVTDHVIPDKAGGSEVQGLRQRHATKNADQKAGDSSIGTQQGTADDSGSNTTSAQRKGWLKWLLGIVIALLGMIATGKVLLRL